MDFTDLLQEYGIPYYPEQSRGNWLALDCPWCGRSGKPGLGYNTVSRTCNCWKCGPHSALAVLHELTKAPYSVLRDKLGGLARGLRPEEGHRGTLVLPKGLGELHPAHIRYLRGRGFDVDEVQARWGVQGLREAGHVRTPDGQRVALPWRLFIPIHHEGKVVSWTTRSLQPGEKRKYISAPASCEAIPHKSILYGADWCLHAACAMEGPLDVWQFGPGGVALFGVNYSAAQVAALSRYSVRGVCLDDDAQARARALVAELSIFPGRTYHFLLDSHDPGSASDNELQEMKRTLALI